MRKRLQDIVASPLIWASPGTPLEQAIKLMREKRISCVPVLDDGKPVGMLTERRMVRLQADGLGDTNRPVSEFMNVPVITAGQEQFIHEAFLLLERHGIRHLVAVDGDGGAVGVITLSDLLDHLGGELFIESISISRFMNASVLTMGPREPLDEVLKTMADKCISCVVCAEDDRPLGLITERDMVRLYGDGDDGRPAILGQAMSSPAVCVEQGADLREAMAALNRNGIRRLVVTDGRGRIAGLATQTDIVRGLESKYVRFLKDLLADREQSLKNAARERDELSLYLESIMESPMDTGILGADTDLNVIYCNDAACRVMGGRDRRPRGRKIDEIHELAKGSAEPFERILEKVTQKGSHAFTYSRSHGEDEKHFQARVSGVWDLNKKLVGYVYMVQDITERKKAEENIRFMAYHDILTGLPNRVAFDERLALELARAERKRHQLAVMVVDLDRFKEVNDTMGHFAGDMLLKEVSGRMLSCLRKSDTLARFGGDEFILVLPEINTPKDAEVIAQKLALAMDEPVDLKDEPYKATLSMGIALYPRHARSRKGLIEIADQAMYKAKQAGRGTGRSNYFTARRGAAA